MDLSCHQIGWIVVESPQCDCDTKQDCGEYSYELKLFFAEEGADIGDAFLYFHVPECG